jgi:hypothetical protein
MADDNASRRVPQYAAPRDYVNLSGKTPRKRWRARLRESRRCCMVRMHL